MKKKEIIDGLKFTVDMFLFDPSTGEKYTEPRNDMDKTTIDACKGAIELLEQTQWIPVSERLPQQRGIYIVTEKVFSLDDREHKGRYNTMVEQVEYCNGKWQRASFFEIIAWMPLPQPYKESEEVRKYEQNNLSLC